MGAQYYANGGFFDMFAPKPGDPSQTTHPSVEQFRKTYIFLAPTTYPTLYADVTAAKDAKLTLDGKAVTAPWTPIGSTTFGVYRLDLTKSGQDGAHNLTSTEPVGVQVLGYGSYTSFQYPAGLNLNIIAAPPSIVN